MKEPSPRASRLALTAAFVATAVIGGSGFLLGQRSVVDRRAAPLPAPIAPVPVAAPVEDVPRTLGRADLIDLAATAADAEARGTATPEATREAIGKPFTIALPFGCEGPASADSEAAMRWRYDEATQALRVHVAPVAWSPADWLPDSAVAGIEAIEGFWIARPWTGSETCPPSRAPAGGGGTEPLALPAQALAIGQLFATGGGRQTRRDGKAYTAVLRMAPDAVPGDRGLRLRLAGRIAAAPDGGAAICRQPGGAEQRPVCMIVTDLDEITIENAATGQILATWPAAEARSAN